MSEKIKNYIGIAVIGSLAALSLAAISFVHVYGKSAEPSSFRSFNTTGEGKVVAVPDIATFSFSVITEGKNVADARKSNIDKGNATIAFLKEQGIDAKDIRTTEFAVEPKYTYYNCGPRVMGGVTSESCPPPSISGYTIRQSVSVKVRDMAKAGDILGGVSDKGANSVSGLSFEVDDLEAVKQKARETAIGEAKAKAKATAKAGGFRLGKLLSLEEAGTTPPMYYAKTMAADSTGAENQSAPAIEAGSDEITVRMTLTYEIE